MNVFESILQAIFAPIALCMEHPWLALVPACFFSGISLARWRSVPPRRRRALVVASLIWFAYAIYEWRMSLWAETVIVPIRVDLLLVAPALYFATVAGLVALRESFGRGQQAGKV